MSRKNIIALTSGIVGFILIFLTTWFSLIFKNPYYQHYIFSAFVAGVAGIILFGLSIFAIYKSETQTEPSVWRLAEKITILLGFIFVSTAWFFSGFRGTLQNLLHPWAWVLSFIGIILTIIGFLSRTERTKKKD